MSLYIYIVTTLLVSARRLVDKEISNEILIGYKIIVYIKVKVKPLGLQVVGALPEFLDNRHMKVGRFSAIHTGRHCPRRQPRYSFLLQAKSTPGPYCG